LSVDITKANDANGDGTFTDAEQAKTAGQTVPFRITVHNTSKVPVVVSTLTDEWPGRAAFDLTSCTAIFGQTLAAGATASCDFSETNYAPATGLSRVNTVKTTVHEVNNNANTASDQATSTVTGPNTPVLSVTVNKLNDANGDKSFTKSETAKTVGQTVPFQVVVTNTSAVPAVVGSLTDEWPGKAAFSLDQACPGLVGSTLAAGASSTPCVFNEANYAPAAGSSLTNTVKALVHEVGATGNTAQGQSTSTVIGPTTPVLAVTVNKVNDANSDGTFTKSETAKTVGQTVPFQATITNTSATPVVVGALTDEWPGMPAFTLATACSGIVGTTLDPGQSKLCSFSETNYGPASGASLTDTVKVDVHQPGNTANTAHGESTSTVADRARRPCR